jgi:hypothetical protein
MVGFFFGNGTKYPHVKGFMLGGDRLMCGVKTALSNHSKPGE